jgi:hypothetical protein
MLLLRTACLLVGCVVLAADDSVDIVASLGRRDGSFTEFARTHDPAQPVVYRAGTSAVREWPAYHPGVFDALVGRSTMQHDWVDVEPAPRPAPFELHFDATTTRGTFLLHLDALVRHRRPAAPRYAITINGRPFGSYRIEPHPAPELWWPNGGEADGNTQYFGYASLDVPLPGSSFVRGRNTLAFECIDGFGLYYDDLSLTHTPADPPAVVGVTVEPTVLFKRRAGGLTELVRVRVRTTRPLGRTALALSLGSDRVETPVTHDTAGDLEAMFEVPAANGRLPVAVRLVGQERSLYEGTFTPKRRWNVYAVPMEQADFGYNDLPARTLEWENRFIDKALDIQSAFRSYSFTLDAAANLDSYLATRDGATAARLLDHLRSGKWGLNALYANFFTGLMSAEELYRAVEFALRAGQRYGFAVDSASQTDEPSVTWALPQVLADAGIKYFTNGSDPIRGALNPIGLLNLRSPFYWEAPDGARVLMWSGVSYTAVDDMTWGGWNAEAVASAQYAPSIQGLERSLPLFLSQYERDDFPFDAVQLFGLHNDEIPMRHWGDADVIDLWNKEFAYPRIIPAPQRDFFEYITKRFGNRVETLRGDGGAYWEDEAGADARIASLIRSAQTQLTAAETFESIARWLQPHLRFDPRPFDDAWKNIMLADSYVWSDATSFRRPESYRTLEGEAAHRAWAEAAFQQTKDLRLVAMDKIADLVRTDRPGAVVFNPESRVRSDFFDFELEPDEALADPVTGRLLPCGTLRRLTGYLDVRCWASDVPATGYKFYAVVKGAVPQGTPLTLDRAVPTVENPHYRLQLDAATGAIAHLIDRATGVDMVNAKSAYRLNEYLYVTGGDPGAVIPGSLKDNRLLAADATLPVPALTVHRPALIGTPRAARFPWGTVVTVRAHAMNTPEIVSTITLLDARQQIDIRNEVVKTATLSKEGVYFAFPFAVTRPAVRYQSATAWVDPVRDMLPGANRQWFATQGGVWSTGDTVSAALATVDAPLITIGDINRGLWPASLDIRDGAVFSYAMNNYWYTDTPARQGGRFTFRYALTTGANVTIEDAQTLAAHQRSPLFALRRYNMGWRQTLDPAGTGFVSASPAAAQILTIRSLAEPDSYLLRVRNGTPRDIDVRLRFAHLATREACVSSVLGACRRPLAISENELALPMRGHQITSLVIRAHPPRP